MDLYFEDDEVVVAIEMQHDEEATLVGRAFFTGAVLSAYLSKRGATYEQLKQVRVTFIYLHDPSGYDDCYNPMGLRWHKHPEVEVDQSPLLDFYFVYGKNLTVVELAIAHDRSIYRQGVIEGRNEGRSEALHEAAIAAIEGGAEDAFVARIGKMTIKEVIALRSGMASNS